MYAIVLLKVVKNSYVFFNRLNICPTILFVLPICLLANYFLPPRMKQFSSDHNNHHFPIIQVQIHEILLPHYCHCLNMQVTMEWNGIFVSIQNRTKRVEVVLSSMSLLIQFKKKKKITRTTVGSQ